MQTISKEKEFLMSVPKRNSPKRNRIRKREATVAIEPGLMTVPNEEIISLVKDEVLKSLSEVAPTGGTNMNNQFDQLLKEINEIKKMVKETNDKVSEIDKNVAVLEERSKHTATKAFVLITGLGTVVTILGSILGFANFFK